MRGREVRNKGRRGSAGLKRVWGGIEGGARKGRNGARGDC